MKIYTFTNNNDIIQGELLTTKKSLVLVFVIHSTGNFSYYRIYCLQK